MLLMPVTAALMLAVAAIPAALTMTVGSETAFAGNPDKVVWGGGKKKSSTYSGKYVPHVIDVLNQNRLSGYEWGGPSQGTVMNAELVTQNPTHLALGQLDILENLSGTPMPDGSGNYAFTILHKNIGPECLYAVTAQEGYSTWGHVLGNAWDLTIYTGGEKSGSYGTLKGLMEIYPDLEDVEVVHAGGNKAIIEAVKTKPSSMGFFVMRPDPASSIFKDIDSAGLSLIPVVDFDLEDVYEFMTLKVASGGFFSDAKYHNTACTSVALITGDPASLDANDKKQKRQLRRLKATINRVRAVESDTLKPNLSSWRDMWDSMKAMTKDAATDLMEASKKAMAEAAQQLNN